MRRGEDSGVWWSQLLKDCGRDAEVEEAVLRTGAWLLLGTYAPLCALEWLAIFRRPGSPQLRRPGSPELRRPGSPQRLLPMQEQLLQRHQADFDGANGSGAGVAAAAAYGGLALMFLGSSPSMDGGSFSQTFPGKQEFWGR